MIPTEDWAGTDAMEFTVLGCSGPYPGPMGACSGYVLKAGGKTILLDCGSGVLARLQDKGLVNELDLLVLTHLHSDHMSDALTLRYARQFQSGDKLKLLMPDEPAAESYILSQSGIYESETIEQGKEYRFGKVSVKFMQTLHPARCYAVRVESEKKIFVYTGDTAYTPAMKQFAQHADLFVCDSSFSEAQKRPDAPHATAMETAKMAAEAQVKRLVLTHFEPGTDVQLLLSEAKSVFGYAVTAYENMTISL